MFNKNIVRKPEIHIGNRKIYNSEIAKLQWASEVINAENLPSMLRGLYSVLRPNVPIGTESCSALGQL